MSFLTGRWLPWGLVVLAGAYLGYLFYSEHTKQVQEETKMLGIKNPAETKREVVNRVISKVVEHPSGEIEKTNTIETIDSSSDKHPEVPTISNPIRHWYISVCAGPKIGEDYKKMYYGIGAGANFFDWLSGGLRYDDFDGTGRGRIAAELRLNF